MTAAQAPRLLADPRPVIVASGGGHALAGGRCRACGHALTRRLPRCPWCRGEVAAERFGPEGAVWAVTVLHVPAGDRDAPYTLAYVDLDDGPRLLVHLTERAEIGARVRLAEPTPAGDPGAEVLR
jgi:uncharacterized OB-fold protein